MFSKPFNMVVKVSILRIVSRVNRLDKGQRIQQDGNMLVGVATNETWVWNHC